MSEALARPKSAAPTHMDSHSLHIVVSRPTGKYRDGKRPYRLFVDGDHAGDIGPGEQLAFPTSEGLHRVQARIDWTGSPGVDVVVAPNQTPRLVVRPAGSAAMGLFQIFGRTSYLKLEQH